MVNDAVRGGGRKNRGHLLLTSPGVWESRVSSKPLVLGLNLPLGLPLHFWKRKPLLSLMPISRGYFGLLLVPVPIFNCPWHPRTHSTRSKEELLCPPPAPTLRRRVFRKCDFCSKGSGGGGVEGTLLWRRDTFTLTEGHIYTNVDRFLNTKQTSPPKNVPVLKIFIWSVEWGEVRSDLIWSVLTSRGRNVPLT